MLKFCILSLCYVEETPFVIHFKRGENLLWSEFGFGTTITTNDKRVYCYNSECALLLMSNMLTCLV